MVLYAFCRVADDAVDRNEGKLDALAALHRRLDGVYSGQPQDDPVDRALSVVADAHQIPRSIWDSMLEGFRWDIEGRTYETLSDLLAYCARVACTVGTMLTLVIGDRRPAVLARACDLGAAMQLTNIARDVGEDARAGRLYLPRSWMIEQGLDPERFLGSPAFSAPLGRVVERLLQAADTLYGHADLGIANLPWDCRFAIRAARLIYSDIGTNIRAHGCDSVSRRATTSGGRKLWLLLRSAAVAFWRPHTPSPIPALDEVRFLVDAVGPGPAPLAGALPVAQGAS